MAPLVNSCGDFFARLLEGCVAEISAVLELLLVLVVAVLLVVLVTSKFVASPCGSCFLFVFLELLVWACSFLSILVFVLVFVSFVISFCFDFGFEFEFGFNCLLSLLVSPSSERCEFGVLASSSSSSPLTLLVGLLVLGLLLELLREACFFLDPESAQTIEEQRGRLPLINFR